MISTWSVSDILTGYLFSNKKNRFRQLVIASWNVESGSKTTQYSSLGSRKISLTEEETYGVSIFQGHWRMCDWSAIRGGGTNETIHRHSSGRKPTITLNGSYDNQCSTGSTLNSPALSSILLERIWSEPNWEECCGDAFLVHRSAI